MLKNITFFYLRQTPSTMIKIFRYVLGMILAIGMMLAAPFHSLLKED
jgi:hypothetical protein